MKKKTFTLAVLLFAFVSVFCQTEKKWTKEDKKAFHKQFMENYKAKADQPYSDGTVDTSQRYFFRTYDDFVNKKPVEGMKYAGKRKMLIGTESVRVLENNSFDYKKVKDLEYWGCIDEWGQVIRFYDNNSYYTLALGKVSSYIKALDAQISTDKDGKVHLAWTVDQTGGYVDFLSDTPTGELEKFSEKKLEQKMTKHPELFQQFKDEHEDKHDTNRRGMFTFKIAKYANAYNEKEE